MKKFYLLVILAVFILQTISFGQEKKAEEKIVKKEEVQKVKTEDVKVDKTKEIKTEKPADKQEKDVKTEKASDKPAKEAEAKKDKEAKKEEKSNKQTACPVCGAEIDKKISQYYKGEKVYFCQEKCREAFIVDPAQYMKVLKDSGVEIEKVKDYKPIPQTNSPYSGGKIDKNIFAEEEIEEIGMCKIYFSNEKELDGFSSMVGSEKAPIAQKLIDLGFKIKSDSK